MTRLRRFARGAQLFGSCVACGVLLFFVMRDDDKRWEEEGR